MIDHRILDIADAHAPPESGIVAPGPIGLRVHDVHALHVVDEDPARSAELMPGVEVVAVLVEHLYAIVGAIPDVEPAFRVHGKRMRISKFSVLAPGAPPFHEVVAFSVVFHDAIVVAAPMAVCDEDRTVGCDKHV